MSPLKKILDKAYEQASTGKGAERHGQQSDDLTQQPICLIPSMFGAAGAIGPAFQAIKKIQEGLNNYLNKKFTYDQLEREILGAIVYTAAILLNIKETDSNDTAELLDKLMKGLPVNATQEQLEKLIGLNGNKNPNA